MFIWSIVLVVFLFTWYRMKNRSEVEDKLRKATVIPQMERLRAALEIHRKNKKEAEAPLKNTDDDEETDEEPEEELEEEEASPVHLDHFQATFSSQIGCSEID